MKAFLLAAGHGTRLRPITDTTPKCLVPIRNVPMLAIWLAKCEQFGIDEILINVHAHAALVEDFVRNNARRTRVQIAEEEHLLGSAGTLLANRAWVASEDAFWVFYADVLTSADLAGMLNLHQTRRPVATLGVYEVPDPTRCGIVTVDVRGVIQKFVEKPADPAGRLAFSGLMLGTPEMLELIPSEVPCDIGFHLLPKLVGRMLAFPIQDYLLDIGSSENYLEAQVTWPG